MLEASPAPKHFLLLLEIAWRGQFADGQLDGMYGRWAL